MGPPTPARRLVRRSGAAATVAIVAATCVAAGGVGADVAVRLDAQVGAHWRGAYDLLVRPPGQDLLAGSTSGLVEQNFLAFTGDGGIRGEQVAAIRGLLGVEVAAPIASVGLLGMGGSSPTVSITRAPSQAQLYRVAMTADTSDGLSPSLVASRTALVALNDSFSDSITDSVVTDLGDVQSQSGQVDLGFAPLPTFRGSVIAVDPVAEQELLGAAGAFLGPLAAVAGQGRTAAAFPAESIPKRFAPARDLLRTVAESPAEGTAGTPVVPMLVNQTAPAPLRLRLRVEAAGALVRWPGSPSELADLAAVSTFTPVGRSDLDASGVLRPFYPASLTVPWPGTVPVDEGSVLSYTEPTLAVADAGRPSYLPHAGRAGTSASSFAVVPRGPVMPNGQFAGQLPPQVAQGWDDLGMEQSYRAVQVSSHALTGNPDSGLPAVLSAPVGDFDVTGLSAAFDPISYVPFGTYDPATAELVADPSGERVPPRRVTATLSGVGFLTTPPSAITDLASAALLRGTPDVDAVRVRVAGVGGYDDQSRERIAQVASAIVAMGLHVDVVAGSSPAPVEVLVDRYRPRAWDALGWVSELWTTLGAAATVSSAVGAANVWLLGLALVCAGGLAVTVQAGTVTARAREAATLRETGWPRTRITRWFLAETMVGAAVVATSVLLASLLLPHTAASIAGSAVLLLAYFVSGWLAARAAATTAHNRGTRGIWSRGSTRRTTLVRTPASLGLRTLTARATSEIGVLAGLVLAGTCAGAAVALLRTFTAAAGDTLLAQTTTTAVRTMQVALVLIGLLASLLLVGTLRRADAAARRSQWQALRACGWTDRDRFRALLAEHGAIIAVACLLAPGTTWLVLRTNTIEPLGVPALLATAVVLVTGALGLLASYRAAGRAARA